MLTSYYTVKQPGTHEIVIQKSRFITFVRRAYTEEEAQSFIEEVKKEHKNANHNCSAYLIGEQDHIQKANDDGEPSGTAGVPMLDVLKKQKLKNTVVVVTRYFGGIKLGAGGLIRAYGSSVTEAISAVGVVERIRTQIMTVTADYTLLGKLENDIRRSSYQLKDIRYEENVHIDTYVAAAETETFTAWITELSNGQAEVKEGNTAFLERTLE
ncbi:putative YigZ family protein [Sinobaca qinghaiensis]|uniref:Putative YigZ family protein n=1 Tax=Sinobaca qinghaiensis TaxID=342944 RepID=A0A419V8S9_9BACL|nr:YigZ family protein [Sinobaca qinghaiensis]RKD76506.1 putative YigZ family protein [Sinobaca qinghaiensis]